MAEKKEGEDTIVSCHCGAVSLKLPAPPEEVTNCNCSLCRRYGVLWAYYPIVDVTLVAEHPSTDTYAWNGKNVDFHRCGTCGCLTHWYPRHPDRTRMGINARLIDLEVLVKAAMKYKDSAGTGLFVGG